jgi:hypothetical protein
LGNLEEGLSTGDFERWIKGALRMECLFTGDPGSYVKALDMGISP